jgi:hypothetical protein
MNYVLYMPIDRNLGITELDITVRPVYTQEIVGEESDLQMLSPDHRRHQN